MNKTLEEFLSKFLDRVDGVRCILVTDSEGVELGRANISGYESITSESLLTSILSIASEQVSKCGMGKNKYMIAFYKNDGIIIHVNYHPLVLTFYGSEDLNVGIVLSVGDELKNSLDSLRNTVITVETELNL
uniref:Roadblock/LAMTOR2 domain-containing protein n=1 Tax=Arcella intermedia TaxID=1963864 RepID=A0A6B2LRS8_9EUKA